MIDSPSRDEAASTLPPDLRSLIDEMDGDTAPAAPTPAPAVPAAPAAPTPAPAPTIATEVDLDEVIDGAMAPESKSSGDKHGEDKPGVRNLRENYDRVKAEAEQLRVEQEELRKTYEAQLAEAKAELAKYNIQHDPEFQKTYVEPVKAAIGRLARVAKLASLPDDVAAKLGQMTAQEVEVAIKDAPMLLQGRIIDAWDSYNEVAEGYQQALAAAPSKASEYAERRKANQEATAREIAAMRDTTFKVEAKALVTSDPYWDLKSDAEGVKASIAAAAAIVAPPPNVAPSDVARMQTQAILKGARYDALAERVKILQAENNAIRQAAQARGMLLDMPAPRSSTAPKAKGFDEMTMDEALAAAQRGEFENVDLR